MAFVFIKVALNLLFTRLETVAQPDVKIRIILELPEESVRMVAKEYIGANLYRQVVIDFIMNVRA